MTASCRGRSDPPDFSERHPETDQYRHDEEQRGAWSALAPDRACQPTPAAESRPDQEERQGPDKARRGALLESEAMTKVTAKRMSRKQPNTPPTVAKAKLPEPLTTPRCTGRDEAEAQGHQATQGDHPTAPDRPYACHADYRPQHQRDRQRPRSPRARTARRC